MTRTSATLLHASSVRSDHFLLTRTRCTLACLALTHGFAWSFSEKRSKRKSSCSCRTPSWRAGKRIGRRVQRRAICNPLFQPRRQSTQAALDRSGPARTHVRSHPYAALMHRRCLLGCQLAAMASTRPVLHLHFYVQQLVERRVRGRRYGRVPPLLLRHVVRITQK